MITTCNTPSRSLAYGLRHLARDSANPKIAPFFQICIPTIDSIVGVWVRKLQIISVCTRQTRDTSKKKEFFESQIRNGCSVVCCVAVFESVPSDPVLETLDTQIDMSGTYPLFLDPLDSKIMFETWTHRYI